MRAFLGEAVAATGLPMAHPLEAMRWGNQAFASRHCRLTVASDRERGGGHFLQRESSEEAQPDHLSLPWVRHRELIEGRARSTRSVLMRDGRRHGRSGTVGIYSG